MLKFIRKLFPWAEITTTNDLGGLGNCKRRVGGI